MRLWDGSTCNMLRIGVLASHQGTNFQAIADACADGTLNARVALLICNNSSAAVMERAARADIPAMHFSSKTHPDPAALDAAICNSLTQAGIELIVLAGYMKKIGPRVLKHFENRIINVHPSLLPKFGGQGYYGMHVHEAVIAAGDKCTGATVHLVNGGYDKGDIIRQERIAVEAEDTATSLSMKVHRLEHRLLLDVIRQFAEEQ